jgi:hypothetical protein
MSILCFCIRFDLRVVYNILVCPGWETSTHYFSFSDGPGADLPISASGHVAPNLCFCILCDVWVAYYVLVHPVHETSMHYFSC